MGSVYEFCRTVSAHARSTSTNEKLEQSTWRWNATHKKQLDDIINTLSFPVWLIRFG